MYHLHVENKMLPIAPLTRTAVYPNNSAKMREGPAFLVFNERMQAAVNTVEPDTGAGMVMFQCVCNALVQAWSSTSRLYTPRCAEVDAMLQVRIR